MIDVRILLLAACAVLSGCGSYGIKGDRGLPPPSETMAYPNINQVPAKTDGRPVRSVTEQEQLKAKLLASRPRTARAPAPFDAEAAKRGR